jgi:hypothetical protein
MTALALAPSTVSLNSQFFRPVAKILMNVTELDYKGIHPTLLYAEAGETLDGDPYDIPGYPRKLVKRAFNIMVSARDRSGALKATLRKARELTKDDAIPEGYCTSLIISALLGAIEQRHQSIAEAFCSDSGVRLQRIDSGMAERVMLDLVRKGIVSLPVHDSFITRAEWCRSGSCWNLAEQPPVG